MYVLHYAPGSASMVVHAALLEAGAPHEDACFACFAARSHGHHGGGEPIRGEVRAQVGEHFTGRPFGGRVDPVEEEDAERAGHGNGARPSEAGGGFCGFCGRKARNPSRIRRMRAGLHEGALLS